MIQVPYVDRILFFSIIITITSALPQIISLGASGSQEMLVECIWEMKERRGSEWPLGSLLEHLSGWFWHLLRWELYRRIGSREGRCQVLCFGHVKGEMSPDIQGGIADSGWMDGSGAKKDATWLAYWGLEVERLGGPLEALGFNVSLAFIPQY